MDMRNLDDLNKIANDHGWQLNPNVTITRSIMNFMNKNIAIFGKSYCPCRKEHVAENICPCVHADQEIKSDGKCHCSLYFRKE